MTRALVMAMAALTVAVVGCVETAEKETDSGVINKVVIRCPRAMYALASARDNLRRSMGLEEETAIQEKLLRELIMQQQDLYTAAAEMREYGSGPRHLREIKARNMEGEARMLLQDIRRRKAVIGALKDRASWHHRKAKAETRRVAHILRHPSTAEEVAQ